MVNELGAKDASPGLVNAGGVVPLMASVSCC
jgi:hypothetical protein